ncbi:MAG: three-Cys-motif partner protein TcmP [Gammaproteobacteria bacterium]
MSSQQFGGPWTEEKLGRLRKYLKAYMLIFTRNVQAKRYKTIYLDAFAGSGYRSSTTVRLDQSERNLFADLTTDPDVIGLHDGSPRIALGLDNPFSRYIFIENNPDHGARLEQIVKEEFKQLDAIVLVTDANQYIQQWCQNTDWNQWRSVVFLDPYGMQVEWATIESIAKTQAIDMWLLFPLGQGVNRLLTRSGPPNENWARRLTTMLGTESWQEAFYRQSPQDDLFDTEPSIEKDASWDSISEFFIDRLKTCFASVANPLALRNSKGVPIFLLCFAAGNPNGAKTAVNIANHILKP